MDEQSAKAALMEVLRNPELMADPLLGPVMRQFERLMRLRLESEKVALQFSGIIGSGTFSAADARDLCDEGYRIALDSMGAYKALGNLLPKLMEATNG